MENRNVMKSMDNPQPPVFDHRGLLMTGLTYMLYAINYLTINGIAGIVAIIAGVTTIALNVEKFRDMRRKGKKIKW